MTGSTPGTREESQLWGDAPLSLRRGAKGYYSWTQAKDASRQGERSLERIPPGNAGSRHTGPLCTLGADLLTVVDSLNGHWREKIFSASKTQTHDKIF